MQVWPNFISVTVRNIICVWVCRELQPLLGPLLMRDCHSWVFSLKADVVSKSASQQINQSFSPKHQKTRGWEETLLIDGFIMGMAGSWKVTKIKPSSQDKLQFARVRYGVWNSSQNMLNSWIWLQLLWLRHVSIIVYKKTRRHVVLSASRPHRTITVLQQLPLTLIKSILVLQEVNVRQINALDDDK